MMGGLHCVCVCRKVKTDTISAEIGPWRFAHVMFVVAPYAKQKVNWWQIVWQWNFFVCNRCPCNRIRDEALFFYNCTNEQVCSLHCKYHIIFKPFFQDISKTQPLLFHQVRS